MPRDTAPCDAPLSRYGRRRRAVEDDQFVRRCAALVVAIVLVAAQPAGAAPGWSIVPSLNSAGAVSSELHGVSCVTATSCFAVGWSNSASGVGSALIERWDGTSWTIVPSPSPAGALSSQLFDVSCASATSCVAVGTFGVSVGPPYFTSSVPLVERWDGTSWAVALSPPFFGPGTNALYGVSCPSASACFAVGTQSSRTLAMRWDGASWTTTPSPDPTGSHFAYLHDVSCPAVANCFAVGDAGVTNDVSTLVEHWDGTSWTISPSPDPAGATMSLLDGVSCTSATSCTAVGTYFTASPGLPPSFTLVERWDGTGWTIAPSPEPAGAELAFLYDVSCSRARRCVAVGAYDTGAGRFTLVERTSGRQWSAVGSPNPAGATSSRLFDVSCVRHRVTCFAVGASTDAAGTSTLVERNR